MYKTLKLMNFKVQNNFKIQFHSVYAEKFSVLNTLKMPNLRSKGTVQKFSHDPAVKIQVVGSGAPGVPSSVLLVATGSRYLFNCGEGTQKLSNEYRLGLEKVTHSFITSAVWKNLGGILGLCISYQRNNSNLMIHGHDKIANLFPASNKFISFRYAHPKLKSCEHNSDFTDGNISVKYVLLYSSTERSLTPDKVKNSGTQNESLLSSEDESDLDSDEKSSNRNSSKKRKKSRTQKNSSKKSAISNRNTKNYVISFIVQTKDTLGALSFKKCVELGVPPGPLLGILKNGQDVTLDNGKVVRSNEVKGPDVPGTIIIVVECPTVNYLDSLLQEPIYKNYQSGEKVAEAVIHFSSSEVVKDPKYQEWINCFPKETKHLFLNEDNTLSGSVSIRRLQFKLNYLAPSLFPLLEDAKIPDYPKAENSEVDEGHIIASDPPNDLPKQIYSDVVYYKCQTNFFINAETLCTLNLRPKMHYDYLKCLVLKKKDFLKEIFSDPFNENLEEEIEAYRKKIHDLDLSLEEDKRIYPKIAFLGTGSGMPSKVRNGSGILIFTEENRCMIFDCGEGTYNQLVNFYGRKKTSKILRTLDLIYVSHLHIDHHLGLITLLRERKRAFDEQNISNAEASNSVNQTEFKPVFLVAPTRIREWLSLYSLSFEDVLELYKLLPSSFWEAGSTEILKQRTYCQEAMKLKSLVTTPVIHCSNSYGVSVVHQDGWKLTYSGDARPSESLVKIGMGSDILIHEATFESAFAVEAKVKGHSTTTDAIEVGKKMNAKFILLTHFSQRYCYLPVIEDRSIYSNVGIAFDFMEVPFNKLPLLPELLQPMKYIFSEYDTSNNHINYFKGTRNMSAIKDLFEGNQSENAEKFSKRVKKLQNE